MMRSHESIQRQITGPDMARTRRNRRRPAMRYRPCWEPIEELEDRCLLSGLFGPHTDIADPGAPVDVGSGDFNGDGKVDLAVTNYGTGNVDILLGNGNGTFGPPVSYHVGGNPTWVTVGDLD